MRKKISDRKLRYFSRDPLKLATDESGARFWSVSLYRTQLTYFEVRPNCRFAGHSHPSEQITLVLDGELFFESSGKPIRIRAGEAIAVPAHVPHAVFTKSRPATAVDAWSPVNSKYRNRTRP
jgi:quercetin dioxygenase-like cupin family protein